MSKKTPPILGVEQLQGVKIDHLSVDGTRVASTSWDPEATVDDKLGTSHGEIWCEQLFYRIKFGDGSFQDTIVPVGRNRALGRYEETLKKEAEATKLRAMEEVRKSLGEDVLRDLGLLK